MNRARPLNSALLALCAVLAVAPSAVRAEEAPPGSPSGANSPSTSAVPPPIVTNAPPAAVTVNPAPEVPTEAVTPPPEPLPAPRAVYMRRYNMAILGAATLLATWGADRLLTQDFDSPYKEPPWIPIVGPWFLLYGQAQTAAPNKFTMSLLVFDGILQAGGLTVGILGLVLHKKRMLVTLPPR